MVKINTSALERLKKINTSALETTESSPISDMYKKYGLKPSVISKATIPIKEISPTETIKRQLEAERKLHPEKYTIPIRTPFTKEGEVIPFVKGKQLSIPKSDILNPILANIATGLLEVVPAALKTIFQIPKLIKEGTMPEATKETRVISSWEVGSAIQKSLIENGMKPETAAGVSLLAAGGLGIVDIIYAGSITKAVVKGILKGTERQIAKEIAWSKLGKPKTLKEAEMSYRRIIHEVHPDLPTGSELLTQEANSAISVLRKEGLPSRITETTRRILRTFEMTPEEFSKGGFRLAKPETEVPFMGIKGELPGYAVEGQPQPAAGLSIQPVKKVGGVPEPIKPYLENLKAELDGIETSIKEHPALPLTKYANKNQELPEVLGLTGGKFMKLGDSIADEMGFKTSEDARNSYQQLVKLRKERDLLKEKIKEIKPEVPKEPQPLAPIDADFKLLSDNAKKLNLSKQQFIDEFNKGLKQQNLTYREGVQSLQKKIQNEKLTLEQFYDKYIQPQPLAQEAIPLENITIETPTIKKLYPNKPTISEPIGKNVVMYHGTSDANFEKIIKNGLRPTSPEFNKAWQNTKDGWVYLARDENLSNKYALQSTRFGGKPVILKVETPYNKLEPDLQDWKFIEKTPQWKLKDKFIEPEYKKISPTTADSINVIGQARQTLPIDIKNIKSVGVLEGNNYKFYSLEDYIKKYQPQLTDFYTQAVKGEIKPVLPRAEELIELPAVIQGETFTLGGQETIQPTAKELQTGLKAEIKATKLEIKNAEIAKTKAEKLEVRQQKIRREVIENIQRHTRGNTDNSIAQLKARNLSDEDIANIVLEDGTKLVDTVKVKRNNDGSLSSVIKKQDIENLAQSYTDEIPKEKWEKRSVLVEGVEIPIKIAKGLEVPAVFFERKGLGSLRDSIIEAQRAARGYGIKGELAKTGIINRFKEAGLANDAGLFTADRFNLSKVEFEGVAKYYLGRQGKGAEVSLNQLSEKGRKFVEIFDGIIKETEPRFYEIAKKMGKTPGKVENYAPLMTSKDFKLIDEGGAMNWLFRNHPAFFSLKERVKKVPIELYELDYGKVAIRWIDGITEFIHTAETTNDLKYLINSDQFKGIVKESDWKFVNNWLQEITTPYVPPSEAAKAVATFSKYGRKLGAIGALGFNYASVAKQALTQIAITICDKVLPKHKSKFAQAFGIDVAQLPSLTIRKGDIAIADLQGKIGKIFTGALTEADRASAQLSLNGLLDKYGKQIYNQWEKTGIQPSQETIAQIVKTSQDRLDLWYGSFYKGDRPEFFKRETGNFILMFLYPLTSQLNGFFSHILKTAGWAGYQGGKGTAKTIISIAEVLTAATVIAYMEQVIENLSPKWSDVKGMTKDVLQSLAGNIPVVSNIVYAFLNEKEINISPVVGNINSIVRDFSKDDKEKFVWSVATALGLPKTFRRIREGMEIMEEGGITDNEGKMLAPVQDAMEIVRSFLRGKYGSIASQDWIRNIGEKSEDRRWFVPQVEFLQNGDYDRKAELYLQFNLREQKELRGFLSEAQQKKLDNALKDKERKGALGDIFSGKKSLVDIFK